jgi:protein-disulfide isomerase
MKNNHTSGEHQHANHGEGEIVEAFKEEGMLTVETLDIATKDATTHDHKSHASKSFKLTTPFAVLFGAIIIAGSIVAYGFIVRGGSPSVPTSNFAGRAIDNTDFIEGKKDSDVIVLEYSDPECPFCVQLHPTMKQLRTEYGNKVAFVYRHFPLTQIHPNAFDESRAIACAGDIGGSKKFYEYVDALFGYKISNKTTQLPSTGKEDVARNIGLDAGAFAGCMKNQETADTVNASLLDGSTAGVQGTPATFVLIKTRKGFEIVSTIDGARPYSYLKAAVDEALTR